MYTVSQPNQRLAILVDADNVEIDDYCLLDLDYTLLIDRINHRQLTRLLYFIPKNHINFTAIEKIKGYGFEVKTTYKNSDAWILSTALVLANKVDVVAFVGVDSDLEPAVKILQAAGVRVEGFGWPDKVSNFMRALLDDFAPLDEDLVVNKTPRDLA